METVKWFMGESQLKTDNASICYYIKETRGLNVGNRAAGQRFKILTILSCTVTTGEAPVGF